MKKIGIIIGSLHQESINRKIAESFVKIGHPDLMFSFIDITGIPLFSEDLEENPPAAVVRFRQQVLENDLILIMTPEYNRSISGVLKNVLDWASRPHMNGCLVGKPVAIGGVSVGGSGTVAAQVHLRSILPVLGVTLIRQPEMCIVMKPDLLTDDGLPKDDKTRLFFSRFLEAMAYAGN